MGDKGGKKDKAKEQKQKKTKQDKKTKKQQDKQKKDQQLTVSRQCTASELAGPFGSKS